MIISNITVEIINISTVVSKTAVINEHTDSTDLTADAGNDKPNISDIAPRAEKLKRQRIHSTSAGRKIQDDAIRTNTPVPLLRRERLPVNVFTVSLSTPPTIGTKVFTANFAALLLTSSIVELISDCAVIIVTKIPREKFSIHFIPRLIAEQRPDTLNDGESVDTADKVRNIFIIGIISF